MRKKLEERSKERKRYYGMEDTRAQSSSSAFINDNVYNGMFFIDNEITAESANTFIQNLKWFVDGQMKLAETERQEVKIYINTPGGDCVHGLAMINAIRGCPLCTVGVATGSVASMGILIFAACNVRLSYEHALFMIHSGSFGVYGKIQDVRESMIFNEQIEERLNKYLSDTIPGITMEMLETNAKEKKDWGFFAEEAKELGLAEEIIGDYNEYQKKLFEREQAAYFDSLEQKEELKPTQPNKVTILGDKVEIEGDLDVRGKITAGENVYCYAMPSNEGNKDEAVEPLIEEECAQIENEIQSVNTDNRVVEDKPKKKKRPYWKKKKKKKEK